MTFFPEGLLSFCLAMALGAFLRAPLIGGYCVALAAGSTAMIGLPALGGATPLIFTMFSVLIILRTLFDPRGRADVIALTRNEPAAALMLALVVVACAGAYVLPRLFADQATTFVAGEGRINEMRLGPVSGNITQPAYFVLAVACALALAPLARRRGGADLFAGVFLAWGFAHAGLGLLDLIGKSVGAGDILEPLRTANYAMLTDVDEAGFSRIVGGFPEASGYAGYALPCLAFAYVYWREGGGRLVLALWLSLLALLALSTSSTAYGGLAVLGASEMCRILARAGRRRANARDMALAAAALVAVFVVVAMALRSPEIFDPILRLLDQTVFNKGDSDSAQERMRWNAVSWNSLLETWGFGIGMGSSRVSSWAIAVPSQLGVLGAVIMAALALRLFTIRAARCEPDEAPRRARLLRAVKACAFGWLVSIAISASTPDPGPPFFLCLAVAMGLAASPARRRRGARTCPNGGALVPFPRSGQRGPRAASSTDAQRRPTCMSQP